VIRTRAFAVVFAAAALASGCIAKRSPAWIVPPTSFGTVSEQILQDLVADGEKAWKAREDSKQLDEAARAYSAALRYDPGDANVLVQLARIAMRRATTTDRGAGAATRLDEAVTFAERALSARNPALRDAAHAGKKPTEVFSHAEPADAPALAIYAESLLAWSLAHGTPTLLKQRDWIAGAATRALGFDPAVGWAAPNRVLATLDCELPEARDNMRDAMVRFEAAVAAAPAYLPNRLAYATEYATRMRDDALSRRLLEEIVAADVKTFPDAAAENADAQKAARKLLGRR